MAYIIVVNPAILAVAGIPQGPGTVATILTAVFGTLLMGIYANRPFAVAPYMGENAFIAFGLAAFGITWQQRLGAVFVSGVIFLVITLLGLRTWLADSISPMSTTSGHPRREPLPWRSYAHQCRHSSSQRVARIHVP